jgi:serine/threonine-protein kinase SRPK3
VIIGAEWDTKADIWNLGCLVSSRFAKIGLTNSISTQIYEFARGSKLFDPYWDNEKSGMNPAQTHLSQIVGLCGDFPPEFLDRGAKAKLYFNDQGLHHSVPLLYHLIQQFQSGSLLRGAGRYSITIKDLLSRAGHTPEELRESANFLSHMLIIDPKDRWPAAQLLDHPWLKNVA